MVYSFRGYKHAASRPGASVSSCFGGSGSNGVTFAICLGGVQNF